ALPISTPASSADRSWSRERQEADPDAPQALARQSRQAPAPGERAEAEAEGPALPRAPRRGGQARVAPHGEGARAAGTPHEDRPRRAGRVLPGVEPVGAGRGDDPQDGHDREGAEHRLPDPEPAASRGEQG